MPRFSALLVAALIAATSASVGAQQASNSIGPIGTVVVAKVTGSAVIIWDATPFVAQIVSQKKSNDDGLRATELQALKILLDKAAVLEQAQSVTVDVTYTKSGAVSPAYGSATFAGVEHVFSLTAPRSSLVSNRKNLEAGGKLPADFKLTISGKLPPSS